MKSIEEKVEDFFKRQLDNCKIKYFTKTESINSDIDNALRNAPSKNGGKGANFPDIKILLKLEAARWIPVMIEVKGKVGNLIKTDQDGNILLVVKYESGANKGKDNFKYITDYAVNGAIHYSNAILKYGKNYNESISIGVNGYYDSTGKMITELKVYYISKKNMFIPKELGVYSDLSFLNNPKNLINLIDNLNLTPEEIELKTKETEHELDFKLRQINQVMQDTLQINVNYRVNLISGLIMAGLGVEEKIAPLHVSDLKGDLGKTTHDGCVIINKIESFLNEKNLPDEKRKLIVSNLSNVFIYDKLWEPINGESKLKSIYALISDNIMPIFSSSSQLDFTGKLFNVLNEWVNVPDGDENDVVLTPRYVTDLMAKICSVDMNSYVWDYATGSAGFLVSSMKQMLTDARTRIKSEQDLALKEIQIKCEQLLGIEKLSDIYMLAVLNMILMGDGSSNIIHGNSLQYSGKYEQGPLKDKDFPANVFLLNPPYSADGKGFIFVEKALSKMKNGKAAILIQENAGSGKGLPYTERILQNNTLLASIHMADIFCGKAGVQTAIYLFDVGKKHDIKQLVKFIDFTNDGYKRQNRRKASLDINLKNVDNANERYEEVKNLVLYGKSYLNYFSENEYIEDTISLNGKDWTFSQHKKISNVPTKEDFESTVTDYFMWKISVDLRGKNND